MLRKIALFIFSVALILPNIAVSADNHVYCTKENFIIKINDVNKYIADPIYTVNGNTFLSENDICSLFEELENILDRQYVPVGVVEKGDCMGTLESHEYKVRDSVVEIQTLKIHNASYYPLRKIANLLNCVVEWPEDSEQINIISRDPDNCYIPFRDENGMYGYMLSNGKIVIDPQFDSADNFHNVIAVVSAPQYGRYNYGCIDSTGAYVIKPQYKGIGAFDGNLLRVITASDQCQYVNLEGAVLGEFNGGLDFTEGYAVVRTTGYANVAPDITQKWAYIDTNMDIVSKEYDEADDFLDGYAVVKDATDRRILDRSLNTITDLKDNYDEVTNIGQGRFIVSADEKFGVIDQYGEVIVPIIYDCLYAPGEGMIVAEKEGKVGYIDYNGEIIIPFQYDEAYGFSDGVSTVTTSGQCSVIDRNNNYVLPPTSAEFYNESNLGIISVNEADDGHDLDRYMNIYGEEIDLR